MNGIHFWQFNWFRNCLIGLRLSHGNSGSPDNSFPMNLAAEFVIVILMYELGSGVMDKSLGTNYPTIIVIPLWSMIEVCW